MSTDRRRRRAVVTGASGFIGRYLLAALRRDGWRVHALSLRQQWTVPGLSRRLARASASVVFHLGGPTRDAVGAVGAAVATTDVLLEACGRVRTPPRVVVVSSGAVYGSAPARAALAEDAPLRPESYYGVSKLAVEALAARAAVRHALDVVVARPFNVIGPGQPVDRVPAVFAAGMAAVLAGRGDRVEVRNLDAARDFVDVRDVADALIVLAVCGRCGSVYNICSGHATPLRETFQTIARLTGRRLTVTERPDRAVRTQRGSAARLRRLGWRPRVSLQQTIADIAREHGLVAGVRPKVRPPLVPRGCARPTNRR